MVNDSDVWAAVKRRAEQTSKPAGFYAFVSTTGKYWDIYYKISDNSRSEIIQRSLTEKKAKAKADLLNSILVTK